MSRTDIALFWMTLGVGLYIFLMQNTDDESKRDHYERVFLSASCGSIIVLVYMMIKSKLFTELYTYLRKQTQLSEEHKEDIDNYVKIVLAMAIGLYCSVVKNDPKLHTLVNIQSAGFIFLLFKEGIIECWFWTVVYHVSKSDKRSEEEEKKVRFIREINDMLYYLDEFGQEWEDYMNELESYDEDETKKQILEFVVYMDRFLNKGTKYTDKMMEEYYELSDKAEEYINPVIINEYSYDNDDHTDMEFITEIDKIVRQFDKFIDKHSEYFNKSYDGLNGFNKLKKKMKKFVDRGEMFVDKMARDYYFAE